MTKHSENETGLLHAFLLCQTKISKEMNFYFTVKQLFIGKGINRFHLSLVKKKTKKQNFEVYNFILLPNILSHILTTFYQKIKNYHTLIDNF